MGDFLADNAGDFSSVSILLSLNFVCVVICVARGFRDRHLWLSLLFRPALSNFTRTQRLACCLMMTTGWLWATVLLSSKFGSSAEGTYDPFQPQEKVITHGQFITPYNAPAAQLQYNIYVLIYLYMCMHVCMYLCICVFMCICVYLCMYMYVCVWACIHVGLHVCMHR